MRRFFPTLLLLATASCAVVAPPASTPPFYVVFFEEKSADLPQDALATVQQAAKAAKAHPDEAVAVIGYTDSAGNAADSLLSDRRAKRVADALVADGVPASRITRQGRGQTHNAPGVESRRVEIRVGT